MTTWPSLARPWTHVDTSSADITNRFILLCVMTMMFMALNATALPYTSLRLDLAASWPQFATFTTGSLAGLILVAVTPWRRTGAVLAFFGLIALNCRAVVLMSYVTYSLGRSFPTWDDRLAAADAAIGFDWVGTVAWFNGYPDLSNFLSGCYRAFLFEHLFVPIFLVVIRRCRRAQLLALALIVAATATHLIALFMPAFGAYPYYGIDSSLHANISLEMETSWVPTVTALRAGGMIDFDNVQLFGIIVFPSFHAVVAVIFMWAMWHVPGVRWASLLINGGMLAATPLHGSHYLVDVVAGVAVAVLSIKVARWMFMRWTFSTAGLRVQLRGLPVLFAKRPEPSPIACNDQAVGRS